MNLDVDFVDYTGYDSPVYESDGDQDLELEHEEANEDQEQSSRRGLGPAEDLGEIEAEWVTSERDGKKVCRFSIDVVVRRPAVISTF